jgi:hypothetical protein
MKKIGTYRPAPQGTCIYFLVAGCRVVYIGQTTNFRFRMGNHHRIDDLHADLVFYLRLPRTCHGDKPEATANRLAIERWLQHLFGLTRKEPNVSDDMICEMLVGTDLLADLFAQMEAGSVIVPTLARCWALLSPRHRLPRMSQADVDAAAMAAVLGKEAS